MDIGNSFQGREENMCKGPVAGICLGFRSAQLERENSWKPGQKDERGGRCRLRRITYGS